MSLTSTVHSVLLTSILTLTLAADAGMPDGGIPDAGIVEAVDAGPSHWKWIGADGGWLNDAGLSDILTVRVGETAKVIFPFPIVLMQCDEPLLELGANEDTLLLTGAKAGHTSCGFWFYEQAWPHRSMDVTVSK